MMYTIKIFNVNYTDISNTHNLEIFKTTKNVKYLYNSIYLLTKKDPIIFKDADKTHDKPFGKITV